jgi:hypothetical protein
VTEQPRWHHTCHHAIFYRLTCEQYAEQIELTGNRCQLCGIAAEDRPEGMLHIDHAAWIGQWAVRGLLCSPCNARLSTGDGFIPGVPREVVENYLANPWYRRLLDEAGVGEMIPEPDPGVLVLVGGRPLRQFSRTWRQVVQSWGPHNIRLVPPG